MTMIFRHGHCRNFQSVKCETGLGTCLMTCELVYKDDDFLNCPYNDIENLEEVIQEDQNRKSAERLARMRANGL